MSSKRWWRSPSGYRSRYFSYNFIPVGKTPWRSFWSHGIILLSAGAIAVQIVSEAETSHGAEVFLRADARIRVHCLTV